MGKTTQTRTEDRDIESGPATDIQSHPTDRQRGSTSGPAPSPSTFFERVKKNELTPGDKKKLVATGGGTVALSGGAGALQGYLKTGLPSKVLIDSLTYMGVACAVILLTVAACVAYVLCSKPADPARQPILPSRP